jgi:sulfur carrier protein ThiS
MYITLKLYGNLKKHAPNQKENASIEFENGLSIRALLSRLGVPDADVWMCAINGTVVDDIAQLNEGDVLEVFEPVGGGN